MSERFSEIEEQLPSVPKPGGNYVHAVRAGNLMFLAGKGALAKGKVGIEFTKEQAYQFARETGLILLAVMKQELGTLRRVKRVVKVLGMVNATTDFEDHPFVINGWRHARSAVGMGSLPSGIPVEIEAIIEVTD
jgi:enamine deaminase RidA (YjgF/YER057c/UK114 family)